MKATIIFAVFGIFLTIFGVDSRKNSKSDGKIVGGVGTDISRVPYQVSIQKYGSHFCGGSIIGPTHILTAAHCLARDAPNTMSVRVGSSNYKTGGQLIKVKSGVTHEMYTKSANGHDIAILELEESIDPRTGARPIQLSRRGPQSGETILVSGWGATMEGASTPPEYLRSVTLPVINVQRCQRMYGQVSTITDKMFCAGYQQGGRDSCQGDSGGPAVINQVLYGVVSFGVGCARRNRAGVYTKVSEFLPWIYRHSNNLS